MCKEDIREGRKKYSSARIVPIAGLTTGVLCVPSKDRTHLTICPTNGSFTIAPTDIAPTVAEGWAINSNSPPADMDVETHGQIVTFGWSVSNVTGGNVDILVIETFWEDNG